MDETTKIVLDLFEKHRKTPGAEFDESHILDFLIDHPKGKGAIRNSVSGLRRFHAFWDEVQLAFGVCFSIKDQETNYSLVKLCERIEQLRKSKRSSKASLKNRAQRRFEFNLFIGINAFLLFTVVVLTQLHEWFVVLSIFIIYVNYKMVRSHLQEKRFIVSLTKKIDE